MIDQSAAVQLKNYITRRNVFVSLPPEIRDGLAGRILGVIVSLPDDKAIKFASEKQKKKQQKKGGGEKERKKGRAMSHVYWSVKYLFLSLFMIIIIIIFFFFSSSCFKQKH